MNVAEWTVKDKANSNWLIVALSINLSIDKYPTLCSNIVKIVRTMLGVKNENDATDFLSDPVRTRISKLLVARGYIKMPPTVGA